MAAIIAAAIAGTAAVAGGAMSANASKKAGQQAANATKNSVALQKYQYDQTRADQEPWRLAGQQALARISTPEAVLQNFMASPDYQYRMDRGINALNQNNAVSGMLKSGKTIKDSVQFGQNIAGAELGDWWNRQAGLAGIGQTANAANQQAGQAYANNAQNALFSNANAQAQSSYGQAAATNQALGGVTGALMWGINNYQAPQTNYGALNGNQASIYRSY